MKAEYKEGPEASENFERMGLRHALDSKGVDRDKAK
jgi:hypothetical protein